MSILRKLQAANHPSMIGSVKQLGHSVRNLFVGATVNYTLQDELILHKEAENYDQIVQGSWAVSKAEGAENITFLYNVNSKVPDVFPHQKVAYTLSVSYGRFIVTSYFNLVINAFGCRDASTGADATVYLKVNGVWQELGKFTTKSAGNNEFVEFKLPVYRFTNPVSLKAISLLIEVTSPQEATQSGTEEVLGNLLILNWLEIRVPLLLYPTSTEIPPTF